MKLSREELQKKREQADKQKEFERKIEEDRLGISRKKQKRVMRFMTYRIIKLLLLGTTLLMLFIYTPAVLPLTVLIALMLFTTKKIEKEKNKNVNKKYRIKIRAADSILAILMIVLTLGVSGYNVIYAYMNDGTLAMAASMEQRMKEAGVSQSRINTMIERMSGENAYERIVEDSMSLLTGNRNIFVNRRGRFIMRSGGGPPPNFGGADGSMPTMRRPNRLQMMRNMPLDMVFRQIFQWVCAVMVGIMVLVGVINVIESFKYGEIKRPKLGRKFDTPLGRNDPCPCGSGLKIKNCCGNAHLYVDN